MLLGVMMANASTLKRKCSREDLSLLCLKDTFDEQKQHKNTLDESQDGCCCGEEEEDEATVDERYWGSELIEGWKDMGIELPGDLKNNNVKTLTLAFCKAWPGKEGNPQALFINFAKKKGQFKQFNYGYSDEPVIFESSTKAFSDDNSGDVIFDNTNGWTRVECLNGQVLESALWTRSDGHKLLIISLAYEDSEVNTHLYVAYDYNPKTRTLTPDVTIQKCLTQIKGLICQLPKNGKDVGLRNYGEGNLRFYYLRWNGYGFSKPEKTTESAYYIP